MAVDATGGEPVVILDDGSTFDREGEYTVMTIDYLWEGGDGLPFGSQDPVPQYTGTNWRDPAIDWIRAQGTSVDHPLEELLDPMPRYQGY